MKNAENSKRKKPATPASWKPGQSGNPLGGPRRGESWGELITYVGNLSSTEVRELLARRSNISMKKRATLIMYRKLCQTAKVAIFKELADRSEGRVVERIEMKNPDDVSLLSRLSDAQLLAIISRTPAQDASATPPPAEPPLEDNGQPTPGAS
jgi:hypothetical protein